MFIDRRNIEAPLSEVLNLVPKLKSYAVIPRNTSLYQFRSGAKLYYISGDTWCVKGTTQDVNDGIREFVKIVKGGGRRKEDIVVFNINNKIV